MNPNYLFAFALVFAALFAVSAQRGNSVLAPAPLWNLNWAVLFLAAAVFGRNYVYDTNSVVLLALAVAVFNVPAFLFSVGRRVADPSDTSTYRRIMPPTWALWVCIIGAFLGLVELSRDLGTSLASIRSLVDLFNAGQSNAVLLYTNEASLSLPAKVGFALLQVGFALAGVRLRLRIDRSTWVAVAVLLVNALLWSSLTTQRSYLLVPIVWLVGGYIGAAVASQREAINARLVLFTAAGIAVLAVAVVFLRSIRLGGSGASLSGGAFASAQVWIAGYIPTFSAWHASAGDLGASFNPSNLLLGLTALVGAGGSSASGSDTSAYESIGAGATSNAPTLMKTVFLVGGTGWAIIIVVLLGAIAQVSYLFAQRQNRVAAAIYVGMVAMIFWSTNGWFFGYGGRVMALVLLLLSVIPLAVATRSSATRPANKQTGLRWGSPT